MTSQEGARWGWNAYWRKRPASAVNLLCEGTGGDGSIIRSLMHIVWSLTWLARHTERRRRFQGQHLSNLLIHWPFKTRSRRTHQECELLSKHPSHTLPLRYAATENAQPTPGPQRISLLISPNFHFQEHGADRVYKPLPKHRVYLTNGVYDVSNPERATGPVTPE